MHVLGHLASLSDRAVPFRSGERGLIVLHRRLMNQHRRALTGPDERLTWHRIAAEHHLPAMLMLQDNAVAVAHAMRHRRRAHALETCQRPGLPCPVTPLPVQRRTVKDMHVPQTKVFQRIVLGQAHSRIVVGHKHQRLGGPELAALQQEPRHTHVVITMDMTHKQQPQVAQNAVDTHAVPAMHARPEAARQLKVGTLACVKDHVPITWHVDQGAQHVAVLGWRRTACAQRRKYEMVCEAGGSRAWRYWRPASNLLCHVAIGVPGGKSCPGFERRSRGQPLRWLTARLQRDMHVGPDWERVCHLHTGLGMAWHRKHLRVQLRESIKRHSIRRVRELIRTHVSVGKEVMAVRPKPLPPGSVPLIVPYTLGSRVQNHMRRASLLWCQMLIRRLGVRTKGV